MRPVATAATIPYRTHERPLSPEERRALLDSMGRALLAAQAHVDGTPKAAD